MTLIGGHHSAPGVSHTSLWVEAGDTEDPRRRALPAACYMGFGRVGAAGKALSFCLFPALYRSTTAYPSFRRLPLAQSSACCRLAGASTRSCLRHGLTLMAPA